MKTKYLAKDGVLFDSTEECIAHEKHTYKANTSVHYYDSARRLQEHFDCFTTTYIVLDDDFTVEMCDLLEETSEYELTWLGDYEIGVNGLYFYDYSFNHFRSWKTAMKKLRELGKYFQQFEDEEEE